MKLWNYMIQHGLRMYMQRDKYAYLYGANGEIGTPELVDRLWAVYPQYFEEQVIGRGHHSKEELKRHVQGKICLDCSSFICYVSQEERFEDLRVVRDYNSAMLRREFAVVRTPSAGTAGSILYKPGHVALDIGYGICLEFANEFVDMRMRRIADAGFVESGELKFIDYTGTNAR